MFIRTAAVYISLFLSIIVTLLILHEYIPPRIQIMIDTNLSLYKYKLHNLYEKFYNKEKEYEISVKLAKKKSDSNNVRISRLIEYLPLQNDEFINYREKERNNEEQDICIINDSKATIQFTIQEKNLSFKRKIFKERTESNISKDKFFNKYMDLKINGVNKYKTPQMERKMDGDKEYVEMKLKGKLRYVGTNYTNDVIEKPEKLYIDEITTRREGNPDTIKITRQPSQGEGYWLRKIHIIGYNDEDFEDVEKKKSDLKNGNLDDECSVKDAVAVFGGSKVFTAIPCKKENDYRFCESVGYISGSVGDTITW